MWNRNLKAPEIDLSKNYYKIMKNKHIILAKRILEKSNRRGFGLSVSNHIV